MRTRNVPLDPAAIDDGGVSINDQPVPDTSDDGLLIVSAALPTLLIVNRRESVVPAGTAGV